MFASFEILAVSFVQSAAEEVAFVTWTIVIHSARMVAFPACFGPQNRLKAEIRMSYQMVLQMVVRRISDQVALSL